MIEKIHQVNQDKLWSIVQANGWRKGQMYYRLYERPGSFTGTIGLARAHKILAIAQNEQAPPSKRRPKRLVK